MVHAPAGRKSKDNNNSKTCDLVEDVTAPIPPDGGWGWVVVFGSFMIHIITDGLTYSFGLFYNEFLNYFNEGKGYTAWICSIMVGVTFASGPISSSFVNRYGCRAVTIAGAILAATCIIISMFAQNVFTLILTIGLGAGFGLGLIYLPAIVSVTTYFEARRSLATGIAVCGSGFGTFVFAPLTEHLIGSYGWRGALLIIGGIVLNCIIFGMMFRPLEPIKLKGTTTKKSDIIDNNTTMGELEPLKKPSGQGLGQGQEQYLELPQQGGLFRSKSVSNAYKSNNNNNFTHGFTNDKVQISTITNNNSSNQVMRSSVSQPHLIEITQLKHTDKHAEHYVSGTMYRPDILYQGSLLNIPEYTRSRSDLSGTGGRTKRYGSLRHSSRVNQNQEVEKCCGCVTCSKETCDTFEEMMNFSLLKDVVFILFAVSNFCTSIGFNMPYIYLVSQAETLNLDSKQSSYLLAIIGIANTVGRIILGYVSDKPWVNRLWVYNVCLTLCGIATTMCPLAYDFYTLGLYCAVFGFTIGAYVGLTSVILVDLLGLDKLTNAFGLLLLFQGIASFIGPPMGGWLYDITESYAGAFILAGIMIAISGLMLFAIPPVQNYIADKAQQENNAQELATLS